MEVDSLYTRLHTWEMRRGLCIVSVRLGFALRFEIWVWRYGFIWMGWMGWIMKMNLFCLYGHLKSEIDSDLFLEMN